jgi:glycosyltransferase involved in cell wall biosynthesis
MRESALVVVPSRHEYTEGLPFVIQEALALRTPVVMSDHPVFMKYFREGEGVRFFKGADPSSLANVIADTLASPQAYEKLSQRTAEAWQSFQIDTRFHHLLERLATVWGKGGARAQAARPPARFVVDRPHLVASQAV